MQLEAAFAPKRALKRAWSAFKSAPILLFGAAFVMLLTEGDWLSLGLGAGAPTAGGGSGEPRVEVRVVATLCCLGAAWAALLVVQAWYQPGYLRLQRQALAGEATVRALWSGGDRFGAMLLWKLLSGAILLAALLLAAVPGIVLGLVAEPRSALDVIAVVLTLSAMGVAWLYVFLGLWLGDRFVTFERLGPVASLRRSWGLARKRRLWLLRFFLPLLGVGLAGAAGMALFCAGALVTVPIARALVDVALTEAYLALEGPAPVDRNPNDHGSL